MNILQWILTKLGTYLVLKRIWNPIDFQGHQVKFLGKGICHALRCPCLNVIFVFYRENKGKILVHCKMGISRSATTVSISKLRILLIFKTNNLQFQFLLIAVTTVINWKTLLHQHRWFFYSDRKGRQ